MSPAPRTSPNAAEEISHLLHAFKLPTAAAQLVPRLQESGEDDAVPVVLEVLRSEQEDRHERRVQRLRRAARLPAGKTMASLELERWPAALTRTLRELARGAFLDQAINVLAFGLPGTGKTHAACALGHALVEAGHSVLFSPTYQLVQHLLAAKRDLDLPRALRQLDNYELLILDDIGYVQQEAQEVEVLFTLLAERYERKSVLITSNLVFSEWDRIFKNPMTTAAAIDRLVHHAAILEFNVPSYRTQSRRKENAAQEAAATKDTGPRGGR